MASNLVAWAPTKKDPALRVSAILCHPTQQFNSGLYMSLLGERIQALVDKCEDPRAMTKRLHEVLWDAGLYQDLATVPPDKAGIWLVWSPPGVAQRVGNYVDLPGPASRAVEMPEARALLTSELEEPEDALEHWAGLMSRLP